MKFSASIANRARRASAFTLAEVLAALLFMAIVIPVAMEGMQIASRAGSVAQRKTDAARIAERVLAENLITTNFSRAYQTGTIEEGERQYRWTLRTDSWPADAALTAPRLLTAEVQYTVQGREYSVSLSTLSNAQ